MVAELQSLSPTKSRTANEGTETVPHVLEILSCNLKYTVQNIFLRGLAIVVRLNNENTLRT